MLWQIHKESNSVSPEVVSYYGEHCLLLFFEKMDSCLILNTIMPFPNLAITNERYLMKICKSHMDQKNKSIRFMRMLYNFNLPAFYCQASFVSAILPAINSV